MSLWTNVQPHLNVVVMCGLGRPIQSEWCVVLSRWCAVQLCP